MEVLLVVVVVFVFAVIAVAVVGVVVVVVVLVVGPSAQEAEDRLPEAFDDENMCRVGEKFDDVMESVVPRWGGLRLISRSQVLERQDQERRDYGWPRPAFTLFRVTPSR